MMTAIKSPIAAMLVRYASRLRFPYLFFITAALFLLNLFLPDTIPFADELLLGLIAVMLGSWRKKPAAGDLPASSREER